MPRLYALLLLAVAATLPLFAAQKNEDKPQTLSERTAQMQHTPGLLGLDWDARAGKLYLEVPLTGDPAHTRSADLLYTTALPFGTGSNDLGLDRGQTGRSRMVRFERTGPKVLLVEPNTRFRSSSADPNQQRTVEQSFARSVMAGFKVEAEAPDGTVLLDVTDFVVRDAHGVAQSVARAGAGNYRVDASRSTVYLNRTKSFPKNTELEAELTFVSEGGSAKYVRDVSPDPHAMTVNEHQSFLELPGPGFTPRRFSPRAGYFDEGYRDYDTALGDRLDQQFLVRHRLIKKDPGCTQACESVAPIQYYVDRGAPEPIRSALVEGARWWNQAFQAAGWAPNTFRVDVLPEGMDPMDSRINIIQWVHRYTRGWSYGAAVTDPRTGEIVKGNVTLGSLRGRQDYLIAEGLLAPYANGAAPANDPMLAMVLQRIRQLAAHETGHTLGLSHNFISSSLAHNPDTTVSVMDYPHPWVTLGPNGVPDLSHAYPLGIGLWDKVAIDYGYREFDRGGRPVEDAAALDAILRESEKRGLVYITDSDARPLGGAHPHAHLWDNGADPAVELDRVLTLRAAALQRFGQNAIKPGTPLAQLQDTLVPLYLFHRYQAEATVKAIGGLDYRYNMRGDGQRMPTIVADADQRHALHELLRTLQFTTLTLPEPLLRTLPPRPPGLPATQESFASHTGLTFDPLAAAEQAADLTLAGMLNAERASRLVEYHDRGAALALQDVLMAISTETAKRPTGKTPQLAAEVARAVEFRALEAMLRLALNTQASTGARAITRAHLAAFAKSLSASSAAATNRVEAAHRAAMLARLEQFQREPEKFTPAPLLEAPPGMPIGDDEDEF